MTEYEKADGTAKRIGTVSYNIYCNFTNYGSALQTWALHRAVRKIGSGKYQPVLVDYCPDALVGKHPLHPFDGMWDRDDESRAMCEYSMPAIRENYAKFERFYKEQFCRTCGKYTSQNFNEIGKENLDGFICGSDTIFCIDEFGGFDDGYYANYDDMKNGYTVAYAASFGDISLTEDTCRILNHRLQNFKAIGLREDTLLSYVKEHVKVPVRQVADPTLLLTSSEYDCITAPKIMKEKYLLLYSRRYNPVMEEYAESLAAKRGWKIAEISLRAANEDKPGRKMFYHAGVEEFLSLIRHAEFVVTNSFHGAVFGVQYKRPLRIWERELCSAKTQGLLKLTGLSLQMDMASESEEAVRDIYEKVHFRIDLFRKESFAFLKQILP